MNIAPAEAAITTRMPAMRRAARRPRRVSCRSDSPLLAVRRRDRGAPGERATAPRAEIAKVTPLISITPSGSITSRAAATSAGPTV